ncbi:MAG TPA: hypothetical protein VIQ80_00345, partial [Candidatus Saccharimonadales bacterium]
MKDLDFDELDRAVNSLMSNVPKSAPQTVTVNEKTLDLTSAEGSSATPEMVNDMAKKAADDVTSTPLPQPTTPPVPVTAPVVPRSAPAVVQAPDRPQASAPAVRRSAGRFMDVVHPSSNMKKPDAPKPVSRQGVTIEPMGKAAPGDPIVRPVASESVPTATPAPVELPESTPKEDSITVVDDAKLNLDAVPSKPQSAPVESHTEPSTDWPDPLDIAAKGDTSAPLSSPFLADAKVEKRPLGGAQPTGMADDSAVTAALSMPELSGDTPKSEPKEQEEPLKEDATAVQLPPSNAADTTAAPTPLPEELQGDLMAVEADTTHDEIKQKHESEHKKGDMLHEDDSNKKPEVHSGDASKTGKSEPETPVGPTSIPQQYHEEPSTGDQHNGAIYDTSTYHQPLAHPAKKKSGLLWVVWVIVILLLGAAGGAAVYFLHL